LLPGKSTDRGVTEKDNRLSDESFTGSAVKVNAILVSLNMVRGLNWLWTGRALAFDWEKMKHKLEFSLI
jgi:hypothetical protein